MDTMDQTMKFKRKAEEETYQAKDVFQVVYNALKEKGIIPLIKLSVIFSRDPAYIASHNNARC